MERRKRDELERFMSKVALAGDCWEWMGGISSTGYGVFWVNGKNQNAHKQSYLFHKGQIPDNLWVLHKCDNKKCVNPDHLYLGTVKQNMLDAIERGQIAKGDRHGSRTKPRDTKFEKNPSAKLSKADCISIIQSMNDGSCAVELAKQYNVHVATIYKGRQKILIELSKSQP